MFTALQATISVIRYDVRTLPGVYVTSVGFRVSTCLEYAYYIFITCLSISYAVAKTDGQMYRRTKLRQCAESNAATLLLPPGERIYSPIFR